MPTTRSQQDPTALLAQIRQWARELGFAQLGVADIDLGENEAYLAKWLAAGYHGTMSYMERHGSMRSRPAELVPGTCRVLSLRMDYLPQSTRPWEVLEQAESGYIARYTLGRDYHKVIRRRLAKLADRIAREAGGGKFRAFVDSAPVLERAIAERAGMGWIAKNTMLINEQAGSWFFLGEIYTDLPLPADPPQTSKHCGTCTACLDICPTNAFVGPFELDARRCISYLTIEHRGSIDPALRPLMGNRIFGCDDCQLVCPWNKFAQHSEESDFQPRHGLENAALTDLLLWDEPTYLDKTAGSALRRIGYACWLRNVAIALGNAPYSPHIVRALRSRANHDSALVREHVRWALERHRVKRVLPGTPDKTQTQARP